MYSIVFSSSAEKDFSNIPKQYQRLIQNRINALASDPRSRGAKKLQAAGGFYRIRQGPYRIIYKIDDTRQEIGVVRIKPRSEAYQ